MAALRHIWVAKRQTFMANPLERLAFIDEISVKTNMASTTGCAPQKFCSASARGSCLSPPYIPDREGVLKPEAADPKSYSATLRWIMNRRREGL